MGKTIVTVTNPWTGALVERDVTDLSERQLAQVAAVINDEGCEQIDSVYTPAEFLAAYVALVGPDEAGRILLGS